MGLQITARGRVKRTRTLDLVSKVPIKAEGGYTGRKHIAFTGANSTGGNQSVTATGTAVGDHVVGIFGHATAESGSNAFLVPVIGTHFESTITVVDKIQQLQAAGDLSANSYLLILEPAVT